MKSITVLLAALAMVLGLTASTQAYTFETLDVPAATGVFVPRGINDSGVVVGYYADTSTYPATSHGIIYYDVDSYTLVDVNGAESTVPYGINDSNVVVGWYFDGSHYHGFVYEAGKYRTLDPNGSLLTRAYGINDANDIVGSFNDDTGTHGFVYEDGRYKSLDVDILGATETYAYGINDSGVVVGVFRYGPSGTDSSGFIYDGNSFTPLNYQGASETRPLGISDLGAVVGWYYFDSSIAHGFVYYGNKYTTVDYPGAYSTGVHGINDSGDIAGYHADSSRNGHPFIAFCEDGDPACVDPDPPSIISAPVTTATEDVLYVYDVNATDPDQGDVLTYSLDAFPAGMIIDPNTGLISWTPDSTMIGDNNVTVRVTDSTGLYDTQSFVISVKENVDLILVSAEPIQAVEGASAFVLDKPTVFKAEIQNTFSEDKRFLVSLWLDNTALVSIDEILVKADCTATYYFPNPRDPTACDGIHLPALNRSYIPKSSVIGEGMRNFTIVIDSANQVEEVNEDNNELTSVHRWTKTKDLVILYAPIKQYYANMKHPCPPEQRESFFYCSPDLARIVPPIKFVNMVYPIGNIKYIQLPPIYNLFPRNGDDIPSLWPVLSLMRREWIRNNPGADREVVLYGWLPTDTIRQGLGWSVTKVGFGDENFLSIGKCTNCGDMHINDMVLAHEIAHMLAIPHPTDEKTRIPPCTGFNAPFISIYINKPGYNILTGNVKDPNIHEIMMGGHCMWDPDPNNFYGLGIKVAEEKWTSPEGWDNLVQLFEGAGAVAPSERTSSSPPSQDTIVVSGTIFIDGNSGRLDPVYNSMLPADSTDGPYTLEILDSGSHVVHTQNFATSQPDDFIAGEDVVDLTFFFIAPFPSRSDKIQIRNGEMILDSVQVTENSPIVSVLFPNGGEILSGPQTILWEASDLDSNDLFYKVEYSFDSGATWNIIAKDLSTTSMDVDVDQLPGTGNTALIKVAVTDGVNTQSDTSDAPFFVGNKPPLVVITQPPTEIAMTSADGVSLQGEAADTEDGVLPDSSFSWSSSIDGILGAGRTLNQDILSPGVHLITLTVTDSDGLLGFSTVNIYVDVDPLEIRSDIDGDGDVDTIDLSIITDQWLSIPGEPSADIAPWPQTDNIVNFLDLELMANYWLSGTTP